MVCARIFRLRLQKAGGLTVSHLRVSEHPIRSAYLISQADFVGCHQLQFIDKYQMAERLKPGGIFLINTPYSADEVWARLPREVQAVLNQKQARLYVINAAKTFANAPRRASIRLCRWRSST